MELDREYYIIENVTRGVWARAVTGGRVMRMIRVSLTRSVCTDFSWPRLPATGNENVTFLCREDVFHMGV